MRAGRQSLWIVLAFSSCALFFIDGARADWGNVDKINQWFDKHQNDQFTIQKPGNVPAAPGKMHTPGNSQKAGNLIIPHGLSAIKETSGECRHRFVIGSDTLFDFDQFNLTKGAEETLRALGPMLLEEAVHPITIEGHTDSRGSDEYNQTLSEKRAQSVNKWLTDHLYLTSEVVNVGFGKRKPIAPNENADGSDNPEGRQRNRRVEIVVDTCKQVPPKTAPLQTESGADAAANGVPSTAAASTQSETTKNATETSTPTAGATSNQPSNAATTTPADTSAGANASGNAVTPPTP